MNKNVIKKNLNNIKRLNTNKSTSNIYKNINTNSIFNTPIKLKKIRSRFLNDIKYQNDKLLLKNKEDIIEVNNSNNIINNNILIDTIMNGDNETIINECFNDVENEICNDNKKYNNKNNNNVFNQCILI